MKLKIKYKMKRNIIKSRKLLKKYFFDFIKIIIGTMILSIGVALFLLPNQDILRKGNYYDKKSTGTLRVPAEKNSVKL